METRWCRCLAIFFSLCNLHRFVHLLLCGHVFYVLDVSASGRGMVPPFRHLHFNAHTSCSFSKIWKRSFYRLSKIIASDFAAHSFVTYFDFLNILPSCLICRSLFSLFHFFHSPVAPLPPRLCFLTNVCFRFSGRRSGRIGMGVVPLSLSLGRDSGATLFAKESLVLLTIIIAADTLSRVKYPRPVFHKLDPGL